MGFARSSAKGEEVCRALVSDRVPSAVCAFHFLSGAGAGGNSAGAVLEKRRQVGGIRSDDYFSFCLLLGHVDRSIAGAPGKGIACARSVAGEYCFLSGRRVFIVAGRTASAGIGGGPGGREPPGNITGKIGEKTASGQTAPGCILFGRQPAAGGSR